MEIPLPEPFASIPRYTLTLGPSPIHPLHNTSTDLHTPIYAKREDLNSALAYGGNKTRKLEYLLPDALAANATTLVSIGGVQSNHTRQVAAAAAHAGLTARLVHEHWVDWPDRAYARVGNIQLSRLMGADVRLHPAAFGIEHKASLRELVTQCEARGERPYYIPAGASDHPLGGLGFARWAFEVRAQERAMGLFFDVVVVCAVTGSTLAGMIAGFKLLERMEAAQSKSTSKRRVIGIDASARPAETRAQVLRIAKRTAARIGLREEDISEEDVVLDENYHEGVYGVPGEGTIKAMEYAASRDAFITDPVYEGKSFAGLIDLAKKGEFAGKTVLYAHLGGQPALNAYSEIGRAK